MSHKVCTKIVFYDRKTGEVAENRGDPGYMIDSNGQVYEVYEDEWECSVCPRPDLVWAAMMVEEECNG